VLDSLPEGAAGDLVFAGVEASQVSVYTKRVFHRLGIADASFHTLRHTAASRLVMQGVDLYAVGQLLGHKTPRMTQRYAHLSPDYMEGAVNKLDGIMGGMFTHSSEASSGPSVVSSRGVNSQHCTSIDYWALGKAVLPNCLNGSFLAPVLFAEELSAG